MKKYSAAALVIFSVLFFSSASAENLVYMLDEKVGILVPIKDGTTTIVEEFAGNLTITGPTGTTEIRKGPHGRSSLVIISPNGTTEIRKGLNGRNLTIEKK